MPASPASTSTAARAMPGVLGVFTGADLAAAGVKGLPTTPDFRRADGASTVSPLRRGLAHEFARYVGEAVAAVVAESREQARDALDAIVLDLEELPSVTDARAAPQAGARVVFAEAPDNIAAEMRTATRPRPRRPSPAPRIGSRSTSTTSASRLADGAAIGRRPLRRASGRIEVRISNQMPTGVAGGIAGACPTWRRRRCTCSSATSAAASA
jgi:carbon-monoxide dehydrogenase large subunit